MYNEEIKKRYIEESKELNSALEVIMTGHFNKVTYYEEKLNKDICSFTTPEILAYYCWLNTTSIEYLMTINNSFQHYAAWCGSNGFLKDGQNHFMEIDLKTLKGCLNLALMDKKIITREELLSEIADLQNPCDQFIMLALFEGIDGIGHSELLQCDRSWFTENPYMIHTGTRDLTISKELYRFAMDSIDTFEYYGFPSGEGEGRKSFFNADDNKVVKSFVNSNIPTDDPRCAQRILRKMQRARVYLGCEAIRANALNESGRIEMIKSLRKPGETPRETITNNREIIFERYGILPSINRYLLKYEKYLCEEA